MGVEDEFQQLEVDLVLVEGLRLRAVVEWAFIYFAIEPPRPPTKGMAGSIGCPQT